MDKEYTFFIVDLSPSMGDKSDGRNETDLEYGLTYLYDVLSQKMIRGKKLDQVSIIALHHPDTENPLATENENTNIKILIPLQPVSMKMLKELKQELKVNTEPIASTEGDIVKSLLVSLTMAYDQLKGGKKGIVNIVVLTNCKSPMETDKELGEYMSTILSTCNDAKIHVASIEFNKYDSNDSVKRENELQWIHLFDKINNGSSIFSFDELLSLTRELSNAIPRLIRPVRIFDGELRLGCDLDLIDESQSTVEVKSEYSPMEDPISICMKVEGYPLVKRESLTSAKTYTKSGSDLHPVKFIKDYRVHDTTLGSEDTRSVSMAETMNVFKYGTSITPITPLLDKLIKFRTFLGIDIRGIIKLDELPICYLTDESILVVNKGKLGNQRDIVSFNSLCLALLNLGSVAIVRYVLRNYSEVNMGALIPTVINADSLHSEKRPLGEESTISELYAFSLVRLPFKEDEKLPNFNSLSRIIEKESDSKYADYIPTKEMVSAMEEFIDEADLDKEDTKRITEERYLTPNEYEFSLPVPYNLKHVIKHVESRRLNPVTAQLMYPSPSIHVLQKILQKIITELCLDSEQSIELDILLNVDKVDKIIDEFNENLQMSISKPIVDSDNEVVKNLTKILDNKFVENSKKGKKPDNDEMFVRNYGDDDEFDIDAILAKGK